MGHFVNEKFKYQFLDFSNCASFSIEFLIRKWLLEPVIINDIKTTTKIKTHLANLYNLVQRKVKMAATHHLTVSEWQCIPKNALTFFYVL